MRTLVKYLVAVALLGGVAEVASAQAQPPNPGEVLPHLPRLKHRPGLGDELRKLGGELGVMI